jgi:hypothetical protein
MDRIDIILSIVDIIICIFDIGLMVYLFFYKFPQEQKKKFSRIDRLPPMVRIVRHSNKRKNK